MVRDVVSSVQSIVLQSSSR